MSALLASCDWVRLTSLGGLARRRQRLKIGLKRGRDDLHRPDPHDDATLELLAREVFRSLDELGSSRPPSLTRADDAWGPVHPLARRRDRSTASYRGLAARHATTGQGRSTQASHLGREQLRRVWSTVAAADPQAGRIFIALDNWPVHFHPDVLAPVPPHAFPWPPTLPAKWPTTAAPTIKRRDWPIQRLCWPISAAWLTPVETLWRWLRQKGRHLHRGADAWDTLKQRVAAFFEPFRHGSTEVLRYVGLLPNELLKFI